MKNRSAAGALLLAAGLMGCDRFSAITEKLPFIGKKAEPVATQPVDSTPPAPVDTAAPPPVVETPAPAPRVAAVDEPWTPVDTGTVNPGMTRDEVIAIWGVPAAERVDNNWEYLYFRNGCEVSCGTFDVVFLEAGQVVDAVVRGEGHTYAGNSSSPAGRLPEATTTPPLTIPVDQPAPEPVPAPPPGDVE